MHSYLGRLALIPFVIALLLASLPPSSAGAEGPRTRVVLVGGICSSWPLAEVSDPFHEISSWLQNDLGYAAADILRFSYARDGASEYIRDDTTGSIDGEGGSAERLARFIEGAARSPTERFDLIAYSQGGIVALYAAADIPVLHDRLRSITTLNSPVQGLDALQMAFGVPIMRQSCSLTDTASIFDMEATDRNTSAVISAINAAAWNDPAAIRPRVTTIANVRDYIVSQYFFPPDGARGILPSAHANVLYDAGGLFSEAHAAPLRVLSNPFAGRTRDALREALGAAPA